MQQVSQPSHMTPVARVRLFAQRRGPHVDVSSFHSLAYVIGAVVVAAGAMMLPALVTSLLYQEWDVAGQFVVSMVVAIGVGLVLWRVVGRQPDDLTVREGFAAVGMSWFALTAVGALPYLVTGAIPFVVDAVFESASGFSTTGSSIVPNPADLARGVLVWRSTTQWVGGMGIIVLSVAILPLLGLGGVQLARAESPGPTPDRLTPRFRDTARRLWLIYVAMTAVEALLLVLGDMDLFQAVNHSLTTMSTGGFGTEPDSLLSFSAYSQWIVIVFMFLAGCSFALHFRGLQKPIEYLRHAEFRLYAGIVAGASLAIAAGLVDTGENTLSSLAAIEKTVRDTIFTTLTLVTTTGFATEDFGLWAPGLQIIIVGLFFVGGMTGSTAGGVKNFRLGVLTRSAAGDLRRLVHPRGVFVTRFGGQPLRPDVVRNVQSFFLFYMFIFMTGTALLGIITSSIGADFDLKTQVSAVASALGNIGPGLGEVGPASNFAAIPSTGKLLLSGLMITGRLEIFPVLLLFSATFWRSR